MDPETAKQIIERTWIKQVHVDEEGYFSNCAPECDDCFWHDYFDVHTTPLMEFIKPLCETFEVTSHATAKRPEKVYTYYAPTEKAINFLIKHAMPQIETAAKGFIGVQD